MNLNIFTWSKVIVPSSGQPLLSLVNVEHNLQISRQKIIKGNWKGVEENFQRIEYIKINAEHLKPLFQRKMSQACHQGLANLCHGISK